MKPILFNTDMVRALLAGRKTVTWRVVKPQPPSSTHPNLFISPPYRPGDILYVRETFFEHKGHFYYKADGKHETLAKLGITFKWRPSIHMPREAARIFLRVTDVRVERLQEMTAEDSLKEGVKLSAKGCVAGERPLAPFVRVWDSTIKPADRALYGWDTNPWVWVIEFERCEKPKEV